MKIFCIGLNYKDHIKEMKHFEEPEQPVIFMKPPTALLKNGQKFYYPEFSKEVHYEGELVLKICKNGKKIQEKFAHKYYNEITLGFDFTARDLQAELKKKGHPWEIAKGFDGSGFVGDFINLNEIKDITNLNFIIKKNNIKVQQGNTNMLIFNFDILISHISQYFTLQTGDLIYTGTPSGVGPIQIGDILEGFVEEKKVLHCEIN